MKLELKNQEKSGLKKFQLELKRIIQKNLALYIVTVESNVKR